MKTRRILLLFALFFVNQLFAEPPRHSYYSLIPSTQKSRPAAPDPEEKTVPNPQGVELTEVERLVIHYTNLERMKRGLPPLKVSPTLQNLSRRKAQNMAKSNNLNHGISPQTPGGENIAWNQSTAKEVVRSWMNSDGHRANILNRNYSTIGVGLGQGNGPYWAQMFQ
jgi:uncharacterized protein YkwD